MSCPRHGNTIPCDIPGLRCDCKETVLAAVVLEKDAVWVTDALPSYEGIPADVYVRLVEAIEAAVMEGYELGLRGGVKPTRE